MPRARAGPIRNAGRKQIHAAFRETINDYMSTSNDIGVNDGNFQQPAINIGLTFHAKKCQQKCQQTSSGGG